MTKTLVYSALAILLLSSAPALAQVQPNAPAAAQVRAGDALMTQGRYGEAAQQYEAGYAVDPNIAILQRLLEAYRLSGNNAAYAVTSQRIAAMGGNVAAPPPPPPGYNTEPPPPPQYVPQPPQQYVPQPPPQYVQPVYQPYAPYRPYRPYYTRAWGPGQRLISAGVGLLTAGYVGSVVTGAITLGVVYSCGDCNDRGGWPGAAGMMFIPVAGPFAALGFERNPLWSVPTIIIGGGMQLTGLSLIIAGAVIRASHHAPVRRADEKPLPFMLTPYANGQQTGLMAVGSF